MLSYCTFIEQLGDSSVPVMEQQQRSRESDEATGWTSWGSDPDIGKSIFLVSKISSLALGPTHPFSQ